MRLIIGCKFEWEALAISRWQHWRLWKSCLWTMLAGNSDQ